MTAPYSVDLRERVINLKLQGNHTNQEIADIFMIGITSVKKYYQKYKNNESLVPEKPGGCPPKVTAHDRELLKKYIASDPDARLQDYRDKLQNDTGTNVTIQCIFLVLKDMGISLKKKVYMPKKEIE